MKTDSKTASYIKCELLRAEEMLVKLSAKRVDGDDSHNEQLHYWDGKVAAYKKVCQFLYIVE